MNRLKELREDKDLFQKDIADYLKIDQSNYSKYELEKISIPLEYLKMLADFYNKYMNELESIWYRFDKDIITEEEAMKEFFQLKETECDKQSQMNRLVRNISKKFQREIDKIAKNYIDTVYFEKTNEETA